MRLAIAISFLAASLIVSLVRADAPFIKVTMDAGTGYIVPEEYATKHKAELIASIPGHVVISGFWTPTEQHITVAERVFRELLHGAAKDPTLLFPELATSTDAASAKTLENERNELELVVKNYDTYAWQFVGVVIDGTKMVLCNYSDAAKVDSSTDYMYLEKYFVAGGKVHFLQCRVNAREKTWSNVSIIGSWQPREKR